MKQSLTLLMLIAVLLTPAFADASTILSSVGRTGLLPLRGAVTDQGDCVNINGKLLALYKNPTSEGIAFVFETGKTRVLPRWVAPADGQNVLVVLGGTVTCTKANGSSRTERRAAYYSVPGAQAAAQTQQAVGVRQGGTGSVSGGSGQSVLTRSQFEILYPTNSRPDFTSPYTVPTSIGTGIGQRYFMAPSFGGSNQLIVEDKNNTGIEMFINQVR